MNEVGSSSSVKDINKLLSRLSKKLQKLDEKKKEDYIRKLIYLFRLRPKLYDIIKLETKEEFKIPTQEIAKLRIDKLN